MTGFICPEHGEMENAIRREGYFAVDEADCRIEDGVILLDIETNQQTSAEVVSVTYECPACGRVMREPTDEDGLRLSWQFM